MLINLNKDGKLTEFSKRIHFIFISFFSITKMEKNLATPRLIKLYRLLSREFKKREIDVIDYPTGSGPKAKQKQFPTRLRFHWGTVGMQQSLV